MNELYKKLNEAHKSINVGQQQNQTEKQENKDSIIDNALVFKGGKVFWGVIEFNG